jgi:hypothetical protein
LCLIGSDSPSAAAGGPSANKYSYQEDWGEKYTGVSELGLFVLELRTGAITRVPGPGGGGGESVGQPAFTPCGTGVVYTSWPTAPKRLGMIYCYQRPCCLKVTYWSSGPEAGSQTQTQTHTLTPHLKLARYPLFAPTGKDKDKASLVFLGSELGFDMHNNSAQLFVFDFSGFDNERLRIDKNTDKAGAVSTASSFCRVLIDHVPGAGIDYPAALAAAPAAADINGYPFPGLFAGGLKPRSFLCDHVLLVESQWRSCAVVLCVDTASGDCRVLTFDDASSSLLLSHAFNTAQPASAPAPAPPPALTAQQLETPAVVTDSWLSPCPFSAALLDCSPCGAQQRQRAVLSVSSPVSPPRLACFTHADYARAVADTAAAAGPARVATSLSESMGTIAICKTNVGKGIAPAVSAAATAAALEGAECYLLHTRLQHAAYSTTLESVLLLPPRAQCLAQSPPPLLVSPHGGPHSAFSTTYVAQYNYLCGAGGFAVLMVNYRGSTVRSAHTDTPPLSLSLFLVSCTNFII